MPIPASYRNRAYKRRPMQAAHHETRKHFVALDALRGIAALIVVTIHLGQAFPVIPLALRAHLAVDFFFMLSGFVVGAAYEKKLQAGMGLHKFTAIRLV